MKRAMKGDFDLFSRAEALYNELENIGVKEASNGDYFTKKAGYVSNFKKLILLCINEAVKAFGKNLVHEQEVLNNIADMMMETYVSESLMLRVKKMESMNINTAVYKDILDTYIHDCSSMIRKSATDAIHSTLPEDAREKFLRASENLTAVEGVNVKDARRRIANKLIEDNSYRF